MNALPEGWSISEMDGDVVIRLWAVGLHAAYVFNRNEIRSLMDALVETVDLADERTRQELVISLGSVDRAHSLEGWAVYVESSHVLIDVAPRNWGGLYVLSIEEASTLWRSLASAYCCASDYIQESIQRSVRQDELAPERMATLADAVQPQVQERELDWDAINNDEPPADGQS